MDLGQGMGLIADRSKGKKVPANLPRRSPTVLRRGRPLREICRAEFFELAGRDRCHVVLFDDLQVEPKKVYDDLLAFLGLDPRQCLKTSQHRPARGFKIGWLQRLLKRPPMARTVLAGKHFRKRVTDSRSAGPPGFRGR